MAGRAIQARGHVRQRLAGSSHAVVTGLAISTDARVTKDHRCPGHGGMTIVAGDLGLHMIRRLTGGVYGVMALTAVHGNADMLESGRCPGVNRVAVVAAVVAGDVPDALADGGQTVVAGDAGALCASVIESANGSAPRTVDARYAVHRPG